MRKFVPRSAAAIPSSSCASAVPADASSPMRSTRPTCPMPMRLAAALVALSPNTQRAFYPLRCIFMRVKIASPF